MNYHVYIFVYPLDPTDSPPDPWPGGCLLLIAPRWSRERRAAGHLRDAESPGGQNDAGTVVPMEIRRHQNMVPSGKLA